MLRCSYLLLSRIRSSQNSGIFHPQLCKLQAVSSGANTRSQRSDAIYRLAAAPLAHCCPQLFLLVSSPARHSLMTTQFLRRLSAAEVLMCRSYGAGDLDPKALNKLIGNQCLRPLYCTLGTGSCKP